MKTKHTPGPWVVAEHNNSKKSVFTLKSEFVAAVDMGFAKSPAELEANARLISCAPEMLEALKQVKDALASGLIIGDVVACRENMTPFVQLITRIDAVFFKAGGES